MDILLNAKTLDSALQLIGVLVIFVFVLVITWLTTKWMANFQRGRTTNRNLNVIESTRVGTNKTINLVKAGKKYFVVSAGKDEVHLIGELSEEDLTDFSFQNPDYGTPKESFSNMLSKFRNVTPERQDKDEQD